MGFKPRKLYVCIQTNILSPKNTSNVFYTTQGIISEIMDVTENPNSTESEIIIERRLGKITQISLLKIEGYYITSPLKEVSTPKLGRKQLGKASKHIRISFLEQTLLLQVLDHVSDSLLHRFSIV